MKAETESHSKPFCLITIPKSGTHLSVKLLKMLTDKDHITLDYIPENYKTDYEKLEDFVCDCHKVNQYIRCHTYSTGIGKTIHRFLSEHSEYTTILQIRDLRDVIVSFAYHPLFEKELGPSPTMDQKLTHILSNYHKGLSNFLYDCVQCIVKDWMNVPNILLIRFEDLIGIQGMGDEQKQEQSILALASSLGLTFSEEKLCYIVDHLFGNSNPPQVSLTFREGKIGSWKTHFKPHHCELFKKNWGDYQTALGYPLDDM